MARKHRKQPEPAPTNVRWTLDNIEEEARATAKRSLGHSASSLSAQSWSTRPILKPVLVAGVSCTWMQWSRQLSMQRAH